MNLTVHPLKCRKLLIFKCPSSNQDDIRLETITKGSLILKSEVLENAEGFITNSCQGSVVANVIFGEAGVGKSTVSSLGME